MHAYTLQKDWNTPFNTLRSSSPAVQGFWQYLQRSPATLKFQLNTHSKCNRTMFDRQITFGYLLKKTSVARNSDPIGNKFTSIINRCFNSHHIPIKLCCTKIQPTLAHYSNGVVASLSLNTVEWSFCCPTICDTQCVPVMQSLQQAFQLNKQTNNSRREIPHSERFSRNSWFQQLL